MEKLDITNQMLIENTICIPFKNLQTFSLDDDTMELLLILLRTSIEFQIPKEDKNKLHLYKVIEKRLEYCHTFKIKDARLLLFLCSITETPGTAIMYLWYLQYWCYKNNYREIDLTIFCKQIFPLGFPSKFDLQKIWDNQKFNSKNLIVNLVDINVCVQSIQFN